MSWLVSTHEQESLMHQVCICIKMVIINIYQRLVDYKADGKNEEKKIRHKFPIENES